MAIENAVENEYGVDFMYHKIREVRVINDDQIGVQLTMTVYSWRDKAARIEGKQPTVRQCIISGENFALSPFYILLKSKFPEFTEGSDDFDNSFKALAESEPQFFETSGNGKLINKWVEKSASEAADEIATETKEDAE